MKVRPNSSSGFLTTKELRDFLDAHEAAWTDEDTKYLGTFDTQEIMVWMPERGYTLSKIVSDGPEGFMIVPTDCQGEEIV